MPGVEASVVAGLVGAAIIVEMLWEGFETIILPRRVTRESRLVVYFVRPLWRLWRAVGSSISPSKRETWLGFYGPLSVLFILGFWVVGLIVGFALLYWAVGGATHGVGPPGGFFTDLYLSGNAFFTAGLGMVAPRTEAGRVLAVIESAMGFGFLALLIGYLPSLNQSFSRREVSVSLLDARAGSPPSAAEMLRRHADGPGIEALRELLQEWERWSAELLESHQSYPALAYFRSQHRSQSWLGALSVLLDTCALVMVGLEGACRRQAELTFAIARHAVVDLCLVFRRPPREPAQDRLPPEELVRLRSLLTAAGLKLRTTKGADRELAELRRLYEPYTNALAMFFLIDLPPWIPARAGLDDWQISQWEETTGRIRRIGRERRRRA